MLQYPRYRKGKARVEASLEPAVPNPNAPEFKPRTAVSSPSQSNQPEPKSRNRTPMSSLPNASGSPPAAKNNPLKPISSPTSPSGFQKKSSSGSPDQPHHVSNITDYSASASGSTPDHHKPAEIVHHQCESNPDNCSFNHSVHGFSAVPSTARPPQYPRSDGAQSSASPNCSPPQHKNSPSNQGSTNTSPQHVSPQTCQQSPHQSSPRLHEHSQNANLASPPHSDQLQSYQEHQFAEKQPLQEIQQPQVSVGAQFNPEHEISSTKSGNYDSKFNDGGLSREEPAKSPNSIRPGMNSTSETISIGPVAQLSYSPNGEILVSTNDRVRHVSPKKTSSVIPKSSPKASSEGSSHQRSRSSKENSSESTSRSSHSASNAPRTSSRSSHSASTHKAASQQGSESSQVRPGQASPQSYGSKMAAVRACATGIEAVSAGSERPHGFVNSNAEVRQNVTAPPGFRMVPLNMRMNQSGIYCPATHEFQGNEENAGNEMNHLTEFVSRIRAPAEVKRARPLICQDITNSNADTLRISRLPRGVTYDRLYSMVEPFGDVDELTWTAADPYVCEVTYRDPAAAHEAKHFLNDAIVGNDSEAAVKAELRSRDPGAQLFIGDLTPDVTEEMLEKAFTELVGEPVNALLKRDPDSLSPIGYGFLSFQSESSANYALVAGHRAKIGNACVRVGRAERNTYLYVSDLSSGVSMDDLKTVFGKFGNLVDEDTVIVRRSYAFIRYKNRGAAEKAKRTLDKTELKGKISVRYAEAEPLKACVAVQFHSSVPRPPNSLRDLLLTTFSKHGNCSVEIPRMQNGTWRKVAFVTFHGEPITAHLAALEAVQSIRFVSSLPVCCQFARELIPRLPARGLVGERMSGGETDKVGTGILHFAGMGPEMDRVIQRNFACRRNSNRPDLGAGGNNENAAQHDRNFAGHQDPFRNENAAAGGTMRGEVNGNSNVHGNVNGTNGNGNFVPVYVPISALQQHPNGNAMPGSAPPVGPPGMTATDVAASDYPGYHPWVNRMMMPNSTGQPPNMMPIMPGMNAGYTSFPPPQMQERPRW